MNIAMKPIRIIFTALSCVCLSGLASDSVAGEVSIGIDSKYVTEGREQLDRGAIAWLSASHAISETSSVIVSYGYATDSQVDYDELDITFEYANAYAGFDYTLAYTRLEFIKDNVSDNEVALSLTYSESDLFSPFVNVIYGEQANGFFWTSGLPKKLSYLIYF